MTYNNEIEKRVIGFLSEGFSVKQTSHETNLTIRQVLYLRFKFANLIPEKYRPVLRNRLPDEVKTSVGIRLFPRDKGLIEKRYGVKIQAFIDSIVEKEVSQILQGENYDD